MLEVRTERWLIAAAAVAWGTLASAGSVDPPVAPSPRPGAGPTSASPPPEEELRVYAPNQRGASVSVLDGGGRLLETVDLRETGLSPDAGPHQVAAAPDGSGWYVTLVGEDLVARFDARHRMVDTARFESPGMVVLDEGRDRLYVSRALAAVDPPGSVGVFRASDLEPLEEVEVFVSRPHGLAVDSVTGRVFAVGLESGRIAVYDPASGRVELTEAAGAPNGYVGVAVSPDGRRLAATTQIVDRLLAFEVLPSGRLEAVASVAVEAGPYDVAYAPDGEHVWFPNQRAGAVTRVETESWTVDAVVRHGAFEDPHGVIVSLDGRRVYVSSHGLPATGQGRGSGARGPPGTVAVLDAAEPSVRAVTRVGPYTAALGLGPAAPDTIR